MNKKIGFSPQDALKKVKDSAAEGKKILEGAGVVVGEQAKKLKDSVNDNISSGPEIKEKAGKAADKIKKSVADSMKAAGDASKTAAKKTKQILPSNRKEKNFKSLDSLQPVVNIVNEAAVALDDPGRTIKNNAIPEVIATALGAGIGGAGSFAALNLLGVAGLSAPGITSALAAAGTVVGGGMTAGIFVLAAPVAVLAAGGVGFAAHMKNTQLQSEKERLYKEVLARHDGIIRALKEEKDADQERLDYLQGLNILLANAVSALKADLDNPEEMNAGDTSEVL